VGSLFGMDPPHISLAAETLFTLGPLHVTNSMIMMFLTMIVVVVFLARTAGRAQLIPAGRMQLLGETLVEALLGLVEGVAGKRLGRRIFPLIATLFIFILLANWLALLPGVGTIGFYQEEAHVEQAAGAAHGAEATKDKEHATEAKPAATGAATKTEAAASQEKHKVFVPILRAANADLNMTLAMALIAVTYVQFIGVRFHGVGGYLKELATPPFLFPVHVISELSRILSLSARLFGNIFGGEVFLVVIFFLFPLLVPLIPLGLELFFGFIQAVLFSVLTLVYLSMAAAGHGGHGAEEHHHDTAAVAAHGAAAHGGD
jgi:F-type H+-transporting ATPase subunit a